MMYRQFGNVPVSFAVTVHLSVLTQVLIGILWNFVAGGLVKFD